MAATLPLTCECSARHNVDIRVSFHMINCQSVQAVPFRFQMCAGIYSSSLQPRSISSLACHHKSKQGWNYYAQRETIIGMNMIFLEVMSHKDELLMFWKNYKRLVHFFLHLCAFSWRQPYKPTWECNVQPMCMSWIFWRYCWGIPSASLKVNGAKRKLERERERKSRWRMLFVL